MRFTSSTGAQKKMVFGGFRWFQKICFGFMVLKMVLKL